MSIRLALVTTAIFSLMTGAALADGDFYTEEDLRGQLGRSGHSHQQQPAAPRMNANKSAYEQMMQQIGGGSQRGAARDDAPRQYQYHGGYGAVEQYGNPGYGHESQYEAPSGVRANKAAYEQMMGLNKPASTEGVTPMDAMNAEVTTEEDRSYRQRQTFQPAGSYQNQNMDKVKVEDSFGRYGY